MEERRVVVSRGLPEKLINILSNEKLIPQNEIFHSLRTALKDLYHSASIHADMDGAYVNAEFLQDAYLEILSLEKNNDNFSDLEKDTLATIYNLLSQEISRLYNVSHESNHLKGLLTQLETRQKQLNQTSKDRLNEIQDTLTKHKNELNRIAQRHLDRIAEEAESYETKSVEEIEKTLDASLGTLNSSLNSLIREFRLEHSKRIENELTEGLKQFNRLLSNESENLMERFRESSLQASEQIESKVSSINQRIEKEISAFESKRSDMDSLLERVGLAKDAEVTILQADEEKESANNLRKWGLIAMYASILTLVVLFSEYVGLAWWVDNPKTLSDLTFEAFAIRFMTVILISSPAVYMLKESAVHRAKENLYRQRGTQLLTIRGYLADIPDKERTEVKQQLAKNFFSFHNGKTDTSSVPDFIRDMKEAVTIAKSLNGHPTQPKRFGRSQK